MNRNLKKRNNAEYEVILSKLMGVDRSYFALHQAPEEMRKKADELIRRREKKEPLAYILGVRDFYGREFLVTPDVLIPRPETENMIDIAFSIIKPGWQVFDIGTGSGCVAITLALEQPQAEITATDVSEKALNVARKNYQKLFGPENKTSINFVKSDLLKNISFDASKPIVVVANLPYVDKDWEWLDRPALDFEPETALYAADYGLGLIKQLIIEFADKCKNRTGQESWLVLEMDDSQKEEVNRFAVQHGLACATGISVKSKFHSVFFAAT